MSDHIEDEDSTFNTIDLDDSSSEDSEKNKKNLDACEVCAVSFLYVEHALRSFWNYLFELDSYRPILALILWIANKISYQEDPTSYSTSPIESEYGGRIYNHLFKNNRALYNDLGGYWLLYKWVVVLCMLLITSLCFEYGIRRLLFNRIMGCWGFKRDKGSFFVFFFALVTAMYLSVLVFDTSLNMMIEKKSNIRTHLNDTSFHRYENETDVVRLTPWCTTTRDAYARMLFFYDKKLVDYDKGKSNYEYLPETYCFFGRTNDTFSKDVYSDEHFQKLYKKHAQEDSEYNIEKKDDDDTSFIKNRCFIRLIAHMSFERYDTMFDTIL
jgi:hypothetical protein